MSGFDLGEVAENTANKTIERALQSIYDPIAVKVGRTRVEFFEDFSVYFKHMFQKCAFVRTILSKNKSEHISDLYVPVRFHCNGDKRLDFEIVKRIRSLERVVIRGNGGSGKTLFFKYLWLSIFSDTQGKIPLFVELRRFNDVKTPNLKAFCRFELQSKAIFSDSVFESLCADGKFIFIFDGFDELSASIRSSVEKQIIEMSYVYRACGFAVSSRDDDRFGSWQDFKVYTVSKLTLVDVRALVEKIDFDARTKKKFQDELNEDFFNRHAQFLSSPLLTTMMLRNV